MVDLLVTQAFVLRWVVRDASVRALKSGHEVSLEGLGVSRLRIGAASWEGALLRRASGYFRLERRRMTVA